MGKIDRRKARARERRDKAAKAGNAATEMFRAAARPAREAIRAAVERPTPERAERGTWIEPKGPARQWMPVRDEAVDMIGALYVGGSISAGQRDAARVFQGIVADWLAELGVAGYRSCLDDTGGGYDAGDGNPDAIRRHDEMRARLGTVRYLFLRSEVEKPADCRPADLDLLRRALDAVNGAA